MLATRRAFIGALSAAPLGVISRQPGPPRPGSRQSGARQSAGDLNIDAAALRARLEKLSEFGRPAGGAFADGVSRVAYSEADIAGRTYVIGLMRAAGLEPRIDPAGNIFARRDGREPALPPILSRHP